MENSKIVSGIVLSSVLGLSGWAWVSVASRVDAIQEKQSVGYQRLAKLDAEIGALKEGLIRIEHKLDEALKK